MIKKEVCGQEFDIVESGDVLTAGIKSQRNTASGAIVNALNGAFSELKKYYSDVTGYMNELGFSYYAFRLKRVMDRIEECANGVKPHYASVSDGEPVKPEHVNELYEWPSKAVKCVRAMMMFIDGMSLGSIDQYFEGLDQLESCMGSIPSITVKHLDLIQAEHWNAIVNALENCCFSLKYKEPTTKKEKDEMMRKAVVFLSMMDETPERIRRELEDCITEGKDCEKAYSDARKWIVEHLVDNTLATLEITHIDDVKAYITKKLPYVKLEAMVSKIIETSKNYSHIIEKSNLKQVKIEVSDYIVDEILGSAHASVAMAKDLLEKGNFQGNELFNTVSVACLGIVYIGPIVGANDKYFVEPGTCDDAKTYGLLNGPSVCKANLLYIVWTVQSEMYPNVLIPVALIAVYYGLGWIRVNFHVVMKSLTSSISICIKFFNGGMKCFTVGGSYGLNRTAELYADMYGNISTTGFEETRPIILP